MTDMFSLADFYAGKKVLITGNTGFKGSWLSEALRLFGADVVGYSLEAPTNPNLFSLIGLDKSIKTIIGDIRDFDKLKKVFEEEKPEIVLHLAAQPIVLDSYLEPRYTYETNVMGTVNVLECARNCPSVKSILNVTTDKVYENNDLPDHPFKENEKLDGYDPYSNSKSCSELVTHSYKRSFFNKPESARVSTARAGNVIGGGDFSPHRILADAVEAAVAGKEFIVRNKYSTRPYQFVLEPLFVYLLIAAMQAIDSKYEGYYNVGPDICDAVSTGDLATLFCSKWGEGMNWVDQSQPNAPHEAAFLSLDNTLVKKTFGWHPIMHVEEAIEWVVAWGKVFKQKGDLLSLVDKQIEEFNKRFDI